MACRFSRLAEAGLVMLLEGRPSRGGRPSVLDVDREAKRSVTQGSFPSGNISFARESGITPSRSNMVEPGAYWIKWAASSGADS